LASALRARTAKMSRISSARSMTRLPTSPSRFLPCAGESSSSKMTIVASCSVMSAFSSSTLPRPM